MKQCPHCGDDGGFFVRYICRLKKFYGFDGHNEHSDDPEVVRGGSVAFCAACARRVGRVEAGKLEPDTGG